MLILTPMWDNLRSAFAKKDIINFLLLGIMVLAIPLSVNLVRQQQILQSRADTGKVVIGGSNVKTVDGEKVTTSATVEVTLTSPLGPAGTITTENINQSFVKTAYAQSCTPGVATRECKNNKGTGHHYCEEGDSESDCIIEACWAGGTPGGAAGGASNGDDCNSATACWDNGGWVDSASADNGCSQKYGSGSICSQSDPGSFGDGCTAPTGGTGSGVPVGQGGCCSSNSDCKASNQYQGQSTANWTCTDTNPSCQGGKACKPPAATGGSGTCEAATGRPLGCKCDVSKNSTKDGKANYNEQCASQYCAGDPTECRQRASQNSEAVGDKQWCGGDDNGDQHTGESCSKDSQCISGNCNHGKGVCDSNWGSDAPCAPIDYNACSGYSDNDALVAAYFCKRTDGGQYRQLILSGQLPCSEIGKNGLINDKAPCVEGSTSGNTPTTPNTPNTQEITTHYKIAESQVGLSSAEKKAFTQNNLKIDYTFSDKTPGKKFIFIQYFGKKGSQDTSSNSYSDSVTILGPDPQISGTSCSSTSTGTVTNITVKGTGFGSKTDKSKVFFAGTNTTIQSWTDTQIVASINAQKEGSQEVKVEKGFGQTVSSSCSGSSALVEMTVKPSCRVDLALTDLDIKIAEATKGASIVNEKDSSDKKGIVKIDKKLTPNIKYEVLVDAPRALAKKSTFVPIENGTTTPPSVDLPLCDIFPVVDGDSKCNSFDTSEMFRQWTISTSASGRTADINQDGRVNSFDYSCIKRDFNGSADKLTAQP